MEETLNYNDKSVRDIYLYMFNPKKGEPWYLHTELSFNKYVQVVDILIDYGMTNLREIGMDEYLRMSEVNPNSSFFYNAKSIDSFTKGLQ